LWVDAICIDQKNGKEFSSQAAQISAIYEFAAKVLDWLGQSTNSTEEALRYLRDIAASVYQMAFKRGSAGLSRFALGSRTLKGSPEDVMRVTDGTVKPNLDDIFARPWFMRLWIIQEIALAKSATL